ncbi:MAG TPA: hypothetical protein VKE22_22820 [Haliangiales bacterium]|nr:hypothetical protein [Haliangiales bacterium]
MRRGVIREGKPLTIGDVQDLQLSLYHTMKQQEMNEDPERKRRDGQIVTKDWELEEYNQAQKLHL